ncbi:DegT/DnrJ/EryC1/StrS family aminotransferase [Amantichitinum ursilacus]|uniref:Putative pyridoxal phosphate-dependent aminotransferase EpsN n=1 Tax=Amantichitinum ursilacus TaxID=857265 RepID=A0A0N0GNG6_9NEIS|nr:DegT/DnrJ/EryC1/StrS family aminotransferase [Amantichitinum ursilacus]KPC52695.1 putative pyridoxal phosphate-dependent aminotransferase EpsN [Amantichitinum ursilacus]
MSQDRILYTKPSITALEVQYATDAAANGWGEHCYDYLNRFEREFAAWMGVPHAIATSSCTGAMHMGLAALDIGAGDEVILADTNWIATVAPIVHVGATPVFVDVLIDSWCIDPQAVRAAITPRTKAIVATHLYGNLCALDELAALAEQHGLALIEDAAEAIGSVYHGRRAGASARFGVFSFHGTKTMTTGEGGMFVTSDADLYERVLTLSNHGRKRGETKQFWPSEVGFKYKMSNLQAALGCAQLSRIDELVRRKREVFQHYQQRLQPYVDKGVLAINPEAANTQNGYWMPTVVFASATGITRERLQQAFKTEDIDARVFFSPLSSTPSFSPVATNTLAYDLPHRAINLPSYHDLTEPQIARVVACLLSVLPD